MTKPVGVVTKNANHTRFVQNSILDSYSIKAKEGESAQLNDSFEATYGKESVVRPLYNPLSLVNILEMNTYHMRCVKTKARDSAGLGWKIEPIDGDERNEKGIVEDLKDVLKMQEYPLSKTFEKGIVDFDSVGYCSWELVRENEDSTAKITNIFQIPSHTIRVHESKNKYHHIRGVKKVWFKRAGYLKDVDMYTGIERELGEIPTERRARELVFWSDYTPRSTYYGLPSIIPAIGAIHGDISRRDYNIAFFENYGVPSYAVFVTGNFDLGEIDEETGQSEFEMAIAEHFEKLSNNPHSALIMSIPSKDAEGEVKVEFKPLSVDTKEASFRLYRQDNRDEILSAHGVPPYRLGISETGSLGGSTAEESTEIYKESVIRPRQEWIEEMMNRYVLESWGIVHHEFKLEQIDTSDEAHDMEMVDKLFLKGAITPNQIIKHFGERFGLTESDHPAMNAHYINNYAIDLEIEETEPKPNENQGGERADEVDDLATEGNEETEEADMVQNALRSLSNTLEKTVKNYSESERAKKKRWFE